MTTLQWNPVYIYGAARGYCPAQSDLAIGCLLHAEAVAEEDTMAADEYFMAAEIFAMLACAHEGDHGVAVLAGVFAARSINSALLDPVRSLEYREKAEQLFDAVEETATSRALGIVGLSLNKLADAEPDDDRATVRLNRIIAALPAGEAQLLREVVRPAKRETQKEKQ